MEPLTQAFLRCGFLAGGEGVAHVFVNPLTQTLEVLRLQDGAWVLVETHDGDATVRAEPFDAVPLELFRLWGRSAPEA